MKKFLFSIFLSIFIFTITPTSASAGNLKYYGVDEVRYQEIGWLSQQGVNLVGISGGGNIDQYFAEAEKHGVKLMVWPNQGACEQSTPFHYKPNPFKACSNTIDFSNNWAINSSGVDFIKKMARMEAAARNRGNSVLLAIHTLHEPYYRQGKGIIPSSHQKELTQIVKKIVKDEAGIDVDVFEYLSAGIGQKLIRKVNGSCTEVEPGQTDWVGNWHYGFCGNENENCKSTAYYPTQLYNAIDANQATSCSGWPIDSPRLKSGIDTSVAKGTVNKVTSLNLLKAERNILENFYPNLKLWTSVQAFYTLSGGPSVKPAYNEIKNWTCDLVEADASDAVMLYGWRTAASDYRWSLIGDDTPATNGQEDLYCYSDENCNSELEYRGLIKDIYNTCVKGALTGSTNSDSSNNNQVAAAVDTGDDGASNSSATADSDGSANATSVNNDFSNNSASITAGNSDSSGTVNEVVLKNLRLSDSSASSGLTLGDKGLYNIDLAMSGSKPSNVRIWVDVFNYDKYKSNFSHITNVSNQGDINRYYIDCNGVGSSSDNAIVNSESGCSYKIDSDGNHIFEYKNIPFLNFGIYRIFADY